MAIILNDNIKINAGKPIDTRYLNSGNTAYPVKSSVFTAIPISERYVGLTVLVNSGSVGNVELWFKTGVTDTDLIEKKYDSLLPISDYVTGATNVGYFSGFTGIQTLPINHLTNNAFDGAYQSLYNYYYRGVDGKINIGVPSDGIARRGYLKSAPTTQSWIWSDYDGGSEIAGWTLISGNIANQVGTFQFAGAPLYYNGTTTFPYTETGWTTGNVYNGGLGINLVIDTVTGDLETGNTLTVGARPFAFKDNNDLILRSIVSDTPNTIRVWDDDNALIHLSASTSSYSFNNKNIGSGAIVYSGQTGSTFLFKTIIGSGSTLVTNNACEIIITSSGSGGDVYACNGLSKIGSTIVLGGTLTGITSINTNNSTLFIGSPSACIGYSSYEGGDGNILSIGGTYEVNTTHSNITIDSDHGSMYLLSNSNNCYSEIDIDYNLAEMYSGDDYYESKISVTPYSVSLNNGVNSSFFSIETGNTYVGGLLGSFKGLEYLHDYRCSYTNRSLIDKEYVENNYLSLYQQTQQTVCGNPIFNSIQLNDVLTSMVTGTTAPFIINSTELNTNLNADLLDGHHFSDTLAGNNGEIQFNNSGSVGASSGLTWNISTQALKVGDIAIKSGCIIGNMFIGKCITNTTGSMNTIVGNTSFTGNTSGSANAAFGYNSLLHNTLGVHNTGIGKSTLGSNTSGSYNTAIGSTALANGTSGCQNTAVGYMSMNYSSSGCFNTAIGTCSLWGNGTGYENTGVGYLSLRNNLSARQNTGIGTCSLYSSVDGYGNTGVGYGTLYFNVSGCTNTAIGYQSFLNNISGSSTIAIGFSAGRYHSDGTTCLKKSNHSIYIGSNTRGYNNSDVNSVVIGACAIGIGANSIVLGDSNITKTQLTGNLLMRVDNAYDIGEESNYRPRHVYTTGNAVIGNDTTYDLRFAYLRRANSFTPSITKDVYTLIPISGYTDGGNNRITVNKFDFLIEDAGNYIIELGGNIVGVNVSATTYNMRILLNGSPYWESKVTTFGNAAYINFNTKVYAYMLDDGVAISFDITNLSSNDDPTISNSYIHIRKENNPYVLLP